MFKRYKALDHQVLTLAIQSGSDDQVRQFLYEQQLSHLPVLNDSNGELASASESGGFR